MAGERLPLLIVVVGVDGDSCSVFFKQFFSSGCLILFWCEGAVGREGAFLDVLGVVVFDGFCTGCLGRERRVVETENMAVEDFFWWVLCCAVLCVVFQFFVFKKWKF